MSDPVAAAPTPMLQAHAVSLSIAGQRLFTDLSFSVRPGLTLLQGGEGRGKSSLLALMAGERAPDAGQVQVQRPAPTQYFERPEANVHDATVAREWLQVQRTGHAAWQASVADALVEPSAWPSTWASRCSCSPPAAAARSGWWPQPPAVPRSRCSISPMPRSMAAPAVC